MLKVFDPSALQPAFAQTGAGGLLERLEDAVRDATTAGKGEVEVGAALKRLIHSPVTALLVKLTPNPADDAALELLRSLFPAA